MDSIDKAYQMMDSDRKRRKAVQQRVVKILNDTKDTQEVCTLQFKGLSTSFGLTSS